MKVDIVGGLLYNPNKQYGKTFGILFWLFPDLGVSVSDEYSYIG